MYVCVCLCVCLSVKVDTQISLKQPTFYEVEKKHTPDGARTHDLSITYRVRLIVAISQIPKAMHPTYISIYQGLQTKKLYMKMTRNTN